VDARRGRTPLVGRRDLLATITAALDAVHERGDSFLLTGEPGIGKSALLAAARTEAEARGIRVVTATGHGAELPLPFAAVVGMVRPWQYVVERLPSGQRDALHGAFGRGEGGAQTPFPRGPRAARADVRAGSGGFAGYCLCVGVPFQLIRHACLHTLTSPTRVPSALLRRLAERQGRRSELQRCAQSIVDGALLVDADPARQLAEPALHDLLDRRHDSPTMAVEMHREEGARVVVDDLEPESDRDG
jgi:AAA ATPase domain